MNNIKKVPATAFTFQNKENPFSFSKDEGENGTSRVAILGYTGGIIANHWWWGNLIIDLEGAKFKKKKYPILFAHDTGKPIGFSGKPTIGTDGLSIQDGTLLETEDAESFARNSQKGFPYEASIYVVPSRIEYIKEGASTKVNGMTLDGPGHVFREWEYKECSVCVFGWDSNTTATAFGKDNFVDVPIYGEQEDAMSFDVAKFSKENPEAYKAFQEHFTQNGKEDMDPTAFAKVQTELEAVKKERDALAAKFSAAQTAESELSKRVAETEKRLMFMQEQTLRSSFAATISGKLKDSGLPERLHTKFSKMFSMESYLTAEGTAIDHEKLSTVFAAEVKEWEQAIGEQSPTVIGGGTAFSKEDTNASPADATQFAAMAALMGVADFKM